MLTLIVVNCVRHGRCQTEMKNTHFEEAAAATTATVWL